MFLWLRTSSTQFFAVDVTTEPTFAVSAPELLFDGPNYNRTQDFGWVRNWDVHPDGTRFIMVSVGADGAGGSGDILREVYLVTNWFEELRARMGG